VDDLAVGFLAVEGAQWLGSLEVGAVDLDVHEG
jgi:hypothetical protein